MDPIILDSRPLGFPWETADPFLFCVHHNDAYPAGTELMGPPRDTLEGREIGQDFDGRDGWRMYHGDVVPGFPSHPHRGFETVTIVRRGIVDHADSLGAAARFGHGDVQWLTAGTGIVHSEMFPLLERARPNPLELFQIWLNLPAADKHAPPHFSMLWARDIPVVESVDERGRRSHITLVAGELLGRHAPPPPPRSWASQPGSDIAIWAVHLEAGATLRLPRADGAQTTRTLYFFAGPLVGIGDHVQREPGALRVRADSDLQLAAVGGEVEMLVLQGRPIGEPVVQYGPFVMNTQAEVQRAFVDYRKTQFGGWPWPRSDPVHGRDEGRFARHADGRVERVPG